MTHWLIRRDEQLYLYGKQGLHQLKASPETAQKLKEIVFGDSSANWKPIDEALANRLLPEGKRSVPASGKPEVNITPGGQWLLRVVTPEKALLLRNLAPGDDPEIMAVLEDGNPQWRTATAEPLLLSYAGSIAAACEGLPNEEAQAAKRIIQIDISGAKKIVEPKILLADVLRTASREEGTGPAGSAEAVDWIACLNGLERLENQLVHKFIVHSNDLLQTPYKIAAAADGSFYCGEGNAEQIVRASCRNLERLLERVLPDSSAGWLVTAGQEHRLERQAEQLFKTWEAAGRLERMECHKVAFAELSGNTRIHAMIRRFVPEAELLEIYVERIPGVGAYRAAAGIAGNAWTDGCCASSQQAAIEAALLRFYALVQQNSIRCSIPHDAAQQMNRAQIEPPGQEMTAAFSETYHSLELFIPVLQNSGISILHLQRKEGTRNEGSGVIPDGRHASAGSYS
ncbi:hypothetical protein KIH86_06675 [Paenibacillus sp. HN-1]|uniref:hypothetical protein n=1 Tax=Paenibacillus TaxID=44249 RepID=UPI001CA8979C|nr:MULTISPECIES: hypothetical protein [Paenibacillus]MBY9077975.1 hypothetical protein [Paenibacillus sp. CGMCC 1.18879]MBY9083921.1 hypothetical protein [Paenibacillus sinensis]